MYLEKKGFDGGYEKCRNYCRLDSVLQEHGAVFSACQILFLKNFTQTDCRKTGRIICPGFGFLRLPEGRWFDIEILITIGEHISHG